MNDEEALDGKRPLFGFVFISPKRRLSEALATAREVSNGAVVVMLVASVKNKHDHAVRELCAGLEGMGAASRAKHYIDSTTVTLVDGLNGLGEGLINGLLKGTRKAHP